MAVLKPSDLVGPTNGSKRKNVRRNVPRKTGQNIQTQGFEEAGTQNAQQPTVAAQVVNPQAAGVVSAEVTPVNTQIQQPAQRSRITARDLAQQLQIGEQPQTVDQQQVAQRTRQPVVATAQVESVPQQEVSQALQQDFITQQQIGGRTRAQRISDAIAQGATADQVREQIRLQEQGAGARTQDQLNKQLLLSDNAFSGDRSTLDFSGLEITDAGVLGTDQLISSVQDVLGDNAKPLLDIIQLQGQLGVEAIDRQLSSQLRQLQVDKQITKSEADKIAQSIKDRREVAVSEANESLRLLTEQITNKITDLESDLESDEADILTAKEDALTDTKARLARLGIINSSDSLRIISDVEGQFERTLQQAREAKRRNIRDLISEQVGAINKANIAQQQIDLSFNESMTKLELDTQRRLADIQKQTYASADERFRAIADIRMNQVNQVGQLVQEKQRLEQEVSLELKKEEIREQSQLRAFERQQILQEQQFQRQLQLGDINFERELLLDTIGQERVVQAENRAFERQQLLNQQARDFQVRFEQLQQQNASQQRLQEEIFRQERDQRELEQRIFLEERQDARQLAEEQKNFFESQGQLDTPQGQLASLSTLDLTAAQKDAVISATTATTTIDNALNLLGQVETGPLAGPTQSLLTKTGRASEDFVRLSASLAKIKADFLKATSGAAVSEQEVERLSAFLPDVTDQENVIRTKLDILRTEMSNLKNNTIVAGGGTPQEFNDNLSQPSIINDDDRINSIVEFYSQSSIDPLLSQRARELEFGSQEAVGPIPEQEFQNALTLIQQEFDKI